MGRVCAEPGCPEVVTDRYCQTHYREPFKRTKAEARAYDKARGTRHQRGYGNKWDKARKAYLAKHSTCEYEGCTQVATDVDHIKRWRVGDKRDWGLFWDRSNWQALCHSHHSSKTIREGNEVSKA